MRLLHITIPDGQRDPVEGVFEKHELPYTIAQEDTDRGIDGVATSPVPIDQVEGLLEDLRSVGIAEEQYIIVLDINTFVDSAFDEDEDEEEEDASADEAEEDEITTRISRDELQTRAQDLLPSRRVYATMTVVSAVIATAGVLMDSAAVVVGSMVLAPLIGPSLAASVGTVLDNEGLAQTGVRLQLFGVIIAILAATGFALLVNQVNLVPPDLIVREIGQVDERLAPNFLALAIALGAGLAGALSLATGISAALVGVMIAVALIPPAAVIGIGIAWGLPTVIVGASVLLALNLLAINLAALGVLWYMGFRPAAWFEMSKARSKTIKRVGTLAVAILVISVFLGVFTFASYEASIQEEEITNAIESTLSEEAYERLEVVDITIERDDQPFFAQPDLVIITLSHPIDTSPPAIADALAAAIEERLDQSIPVEINYVIRERSN